MRIISWDFLRDHHLRHSRGTDFHSPMGFFTHPMTKKDTGPRRFSGQPPGWCSLQHLRQKTSVFTCFYHGVGNYDGQWLSVCLDLLQEPPKIQNILVGGAITILKNMKVNGKDDISYIMENNSHLWNHQPAYIRYFESPSVVDFPLGKSHLRPKGRRVPNFMVGKGPKIHPMKLADFAGQGKINGRSSGSNTWRYVSTIFQAIFCGDIPLHRPQK